eukprot:6173298-Pleurochrysis_carterae.AAC.2
MAVHIAFTPSFEREGERERENKTAALSAEPSPFSCLFVYRKVVDFVRESLRRSHAVVDIDDNDAADDDDAADADALSRHAQPFPSEYLQVYTLCADIATSRMEAVTSVPASLSQLGLTLIVSLRHGFCDLHPIAVKCVSSLRPIGAQWSSPGKYLTDAAYFCAPAPATSRFLLLDHYAKLQE